MMSRALANKLVVARQRTAVATRLFIITALQSVSAASGKPACLRRGWPLPADVDQLVDRQIDAVRRQIGVDVRFHEQVRKGRDIKVVHGGAVGERQWNVELRMAGRIRAGQDRRIGEEQRAYG